MQPDIPYHWSRRDKFLYTLIMLPFMVAFIGAIVLLATISPLLSLIFVGLYLLGNVFQAACCVGCPYRGQFCPAAFGCYLANWLSMRWYPDHKHDPAFFERNATRGETTVIGTLVFACIGLATLNGWYGVIFLALVGVHFVLLLKLFCPKCGYAGTCPAGHLACRLFQRHTG